MNQWGDELQWQAERQGVYIAYDHGGRYMLCTAWHNANHGRKHNTSLHWISERWPNTIRNISRSARIGTLMRIAEIDAVLRA